MNWIDVKRKKENERKKRWRAKLTAWCRKNYGVSDPESVVRKMMLEDGTTKKKWSRIK